MKALDSAAGTFYWDLKVKPSGCLVRRLSFVNMKKTIRFLSWLGVCGALTLFSTPPAWGQRPGPYLKFDLGGNLTQDTDLEEFFGENVSGAKVKFDPGFRAGMVIGYQLTDWFGAEFETGGMENRISSITGADFVHDAYFGNVPLLVNARLQLPNRSRLTPYIGASAGGAISFIDVDEVHIGNTFFSGSDGAAVFAWQAFGGLRFALNDSMGLSVEYHYFNAQSPSWEAEDIHGSVGSDTLRFGQTHTHVISLAFDFHF